MKYKVELIMDSYYKVIDENRKNVFQGSLADCEAWIRLTESERMDV